MNFPSSEMLPVVRLLLAVLLHFAWQATLIVVLVAIGRSLIHPRLMQARYMLSVVGLAAMLMAPLVTIGYYAANAEAMAALDPVAPGYSATTAAAVDSQSLTSLFEAQFQIVFRWFDNYRIFWLGSWMTGFVIFVIRLCLGLNHCLRLRRNHENLPPHLQKLSLRLQRKLNLTRKIVVTSSREITQAVATGIIRPMVLIPTAWVTQLPVSAIEAVLAHELAHVKRWDLWINLLQRIVETTFFFHPLVWWLSQTITSQRELCCDQLAIKLTGQPLRYVETLAKVAGSTTSNDFEFQFGTAFIGDRNMNLLRRENDSGACVN